MAQYAYRPTVRYANDGDPEQTIRVGTAVAVSGAAFSPNMGYHSAPAVSFLMAVFSVRLGLWIGNPRHRKGWRQSGPRFALWPLLGELFGLTNESRTFCNLSDGGHFENLGLYELIRRHCRFVIAVDAGQDESFGFEDLGNAVRKCRVDLRTEISLAPAALAPDPKSRCSRQHCLVGTIRYPDGGSGILVYIKPTLCGNEPSDVLNYAKEHPEFPHQSTLDQWFSESQFESYRKLGYFIGRTVFCKALDQARAGAAATPADLDKTAFFLALRQLWYPPVAVGARQFAQHAQQLDALMDRLRASDRLRFLDAQIYPEWNDFIRAGAAPAENRGGRLPDTGPPPSAEERREGFYFCHGLLQLMECVYLDLDLEETSGHPDHRGWMNLFRHWGFADMVRVTWSITAFTFGARFQNFCERRLNLALGQIRTRELGGGWQDEAQFRAFVARDDTLNFFERSLLDDLGAANAARGVDFS